MFLPLLSAKLVPSCSSWNWHWLIPSLAWVPQEMISPGKQLSDGVAGSTGPPPVVGATSCYCMWQCWQQCVFVIIEWMGAQVCL